MKLIQGLCNLSDIIIKHKLYEEDIHLLKGKDLESVDVITGGFPCQAFSVAG